MQDLHQRRKAALNYHREEFKRTHSNDGVTATATAAAASDDKHAEDEIDGTLITLQFEKDRVTSVEFSCFCRFYV